MENKNTFSKWDKRFIELAEEIGSWSTCHRRQVGAVAVRDKHVLATGYNGAPAGVASCFERGECLREKLGIESGTRQETCYSIHAEQNVVCQAAKFGISMRDAIVYVTHSPCTICTRILINAGVSKIVYKNAYPDEFSLSLLQEAGVEFVQFDENLVK